MLTAREAFKVGFLLSCADMGLDGKDAAALMVKAARCVVKRAGITDLVTDTAKSWAGPVRDLGIASALGLPVMAGAGAGYLAHRAITPEVDEEDVQKQELIDELRHWAMRAREQQRVKALRVAGV